MKKNLNLFFRNGFLVGLFSFVSLMVVAQSVNTTVDKNNILIGEQIQYSFLVSVPSPEYKVAINIPDSIPHFEILSKVSGNATDKKGNNYWQQKIVFTSFDSGSFAIPSFSYRINHMATSSQVLYTDSFRINVGYMPIDAGGKPRDIKSVIEVAFFDWLWVWIGVGVLLLLILLVLIIRYFRKKSIKGVVVSSKTAFEEAMHELDILQKANQNNALPVKEYHTRLAEVLRNYYGKTQNQNFLNKTTQEILSKLKTHELKAETATQTTEALATGDAVKYAKYHPSFTENEAALQFLKNTITEIESSRNLKV